MPSRPASTPKRMPREKLHATGEARAARGSVPLASTRRGRPGIRLKRCSATRPKGTAAVAYPLVTEMPGIWQYRAIRHPQRSEKIRIRTDMAPAVTIP